MGAAGWSGATFGKGGGLLRSVTGVCQSGYVTGTVLFADGGWTAIDGRFTPPGM